MPLRRVFAYILSISFAAISCMAAHAAVTPTVSLCVLHAAGNDFTGGCGAIFNQTPTMTLKPAAATTTGIWNTSILPSHVWEGNMTNQGHRSAKLELGEYPGSLGILRTQYGWFPISHLAASSSDLSFDLDTSREVHPSRLDKEILNQTEQLLAAPKMWSRTDTLNCPADANSWSIYCAMAKVTTDLTGGLNIHRPAFQIIRRILAQRTAAHDYPDRFIGYNNDPKTTLPDVLSLFHEALVQVGNPGFSPGPP